MARPDLQTALTRLMPEKLSAWPVQPSRKGEPAIIQLAGEIENLAWNLVAGEVYYLASGGEISQTPPDTGFVQRIGVAKTSTIFVINLGEPVLR